MTTDLKKQKSDSLPKRGRPVGTKAPRTDAVRRVRIELKMSQDDLARELKSTKATIQAAERDGRLFSKAEILDKFRELAARAKIDLD